MKRVLILLILPFLSGCNQDREVQLPYIKYEEAIYREIPDIKVFQGFIDRKYDVELSFGLPGVIQNIFVLEGEKVQKGKLLAKLDNKEYGLEIDRAQNQLKDAYVSYNRAKSYYERISKLYKAGGISYNDWESADVELKINSNKIKILSDSLNIAKNKEKFSNIYAPYDGYIIKSFKDDGQFANAGETVFYFQGSGGLEARIFVSQNDINSISVGQNIVLKADALENKEFKGRVVSKTNSGFENGGYRVTVEIIPDFNLLLDGMSVRCFFVKKILKGIFVKKSAIIADNGEEYIFILVKTDKNKGRVIKKKINTLDKTGDFVYLDDGLKEGEYYVSEGVNKIMNEALVQFDD